MPPGLIPNRDRPLNAIFVVRVETHRYPPVGQFQVTPKATGTNLLSGEVISDLSRSGGASFSPEVVLSTPHVPGYLVLDADSRHRQTSAPPVTKDGHIRLMVSDTRYVPSRRSP